MLKLDLVKLLSNFCKNCVYNWSKVVVKTSQLGLILVNKIPENDQKSRRFFFSL